MVPAAVAAALPGCFWFTSARAGQEMRADIDSLRLDVDTMRESLDVERARFADMVAEARIHVEQLEAVLRRTTDVLTRNSADFGADFAILRDDVRALGGRLAELLVAVRSAEAASTTQTRRLDRLERTAGLDPEIDSAEAPATPDDLFAKAEDLLAAGNHAVARSYYRLFLSRYPNHEKAIEARIQIGVAFSEEGRHADAAGALSEIAQRHPDAPGGDRVYYYTAASLFALGRCTEAQTLLRAMLRKYPNSPLKTRAEQLQQQMRAAPQCRR